MAPELDILVRGVAVGAFGVIALSLWRSELRRDARVATILVASSAAAWVITESATTWAAVGQFPPLLALAFPVAALFWLFVATIFEDRRFSTAALAPAALFVLAGYAISAAPPGVARFIGFAFNVAAAGFCLHAGLIIARGWREDLIESRRTLRLLVLGLAALLAVSQGALGAFAWIGPDSGSPIVGLGASAGVLMVALIGLAMGGLFLDGRTTLFGSNSRPGARTDVRADTVDGLLMARLDAAMAEGAWRNEHLTIGGLAGTLGTPEHRLRRLINLRLGHRNFADFSNGYRIAAAKALLTDPTRSTSDNRGHRVRSWLRIAQSFQSRLSRGDGRNAYTVARSRPSGAGVGRQSRLISNSTRVFRPR